MLVYVYKYVDQDKGWVHRLAMKKSAGVTPEVNLRNQLQCSLWNPEQMSPEIQNSDISDPQNRMMSSKNLE